MWQGDPISALIKPIGLISAEIGAPCRILGHAKKQCILLYVIISVNFEQSLYSWIATLGGDIQWSIFFWEFIFKVVIWLLSDACMIMFFFA